MRGAPRAGDDDLEPASARRLGVLGEALRRPVRGHDPHFVRHVQRGQRLRGMLHGGPVRLAPHDDPDEGCVRHRPRHPCCRPTRPERRIIGGAPRLASAALGRRSEPVSSDDVGQKQVLQPAYLVFQGELSFLEALNRQLVEGRILGHARDRVVEISMLQLHLFEPLAYGLLVVHQK